jgi:glycosyltransferase involved in cell wall biosynthesis
MSTPMVSIVIPVYNGSDYLREAIDSALAQTYSNVEVIVINDGSKDDGETRKIALSYGSKIKYLEKENGGVATALNTGIRAANGKYISWLSHDDAYAPEKLAVQVPVMERFEVEGKKVVVYSSFQLMNERSIVFGKFDMPKVQPSRFFEALLNNMVFISPFERQLFSVHGCTILFPRTVFKEVGLFDESLRTTQDFDLWFKMIGSYEFIGMDGYLVKSRIHKGQGTYVLRKERIEEVEDMYLRAFQLYQPGSERFDLDLPRTVLAFKIKRRMKAYAAAKNELKKQKLTLRSYSYLLRASLAFPVIIRAQVALRYGLRMIKKTLTSSG